MLLFQDSIHCNTKITKGVNIPSNIQKIIFKEILQKIFNIFLPYQNAFTGIKKNCIRNIYNWLFINQSVELSSSGKNDYIIQEKK